MTIAVESVRSFLLGLVQPQLARAGVRPEDVTDEFDLYESGVLDSLGVLDTVASIEDEFDVALDELDPELLIVVGPFAEAVTRSPVR